MSDFGVLSLLPPLVAIALCFITKEVVSSLFLGIFIGALLVTHGNVFSAVALSWDWAAEVVTDPWNARYFLFIFLMGSGIGLVYKLGGGMALTKKAERRINTSKKGETLGWLMGIIVFFNDYANTAIVGPAIRNLTDKLRISREKLSYLLDSTASPVAGLSPISDWAGYQTNVIRGAMETIGGIAAVGATAYTIWLRSIPYMFYCWFAIALVGIIAITHRNFGPMMAHEYRARTTGKLLRDGAKPLSSIETDVGEVITKKLTIWSFILPIATFIGLALFGLWWTGGGPEAESLMEALGNADVATALLWAAFGMVLVGIALGLGLKIMGITEAMDTVINGAKTMLIANAIMLLAWTIKVACDAVGTAPYVINVTLPYVSKAPGLLPVVIFLICMFISFATGTSWGTMGIVTPIALPLTYYAVGQQLNWIVYASVGAVLSGAIFGDHCSPISDTTICSSIFASDDHMDHVTTQMPYAIFAAVVGIIGYLLVLIGLKWYIILPIGIVLLYLGTIFLSRWYAKKLGLPETTPVFTVKE